MQIIRAAERIRAGGVIAYPTEGVFGLGCDPANRAAVQRLFNIKGRDPDAGLILLAADEQQLRPWIQVSDTQMSAMRAHWPGPVTWLVPPSARVPQQVRGRHPTVAVRVSGHPLARELARQAGTPLISTSANRSGRPAAIHHWQVRRQLGQALDQVLVGDCQTPGHPSTIIDLASGAVIRGRRLNPTTDSDHE